jgi:anthranilate synthase / indole-3-glycerol phosphate synthase / phosphoribosylanthranilate isomerase
MEQTDPCACHSGTVFHVDADGNGLKDVSRPGLHQHVLLVLNMAVSPGGLSGGNGKTFDWELAKRVVLAGEGGGGGRGEEKEGLTTGGTSSPLPIILAGDLTAENVAEAVRCVRGP